MSEPGFTGL